MQKKPTPTEINSAVAAARTAIGEAQKLRKSLRRKSHPGGVRQDDLELMRERLSATARPLRRFIGMVQFHELSFDQDQRMKGVMSELAYERNQIRKMLR